MSKHVVRTRAGQDRTSLYDEITDRIIGELEAGRVPWVQPRGTAAAKTPLSMPKNASTDRQYSGVNVLILWGAVIERGFTGQSWLTFSQALSLGGHVREGERGTTVVYADRFISSDEKRYAAETGDEAQAIPFLRRFTVFNTDQCEGLPDEIATTAPPPPPDSNSCADDGSTEITFGDVRFGPNNELVKFLVGVGKFTKEMADRIGHEVSTEKLKEWTNDPAGSFARSDSGRAVNTVADTVVKPVQSYCDHNCVRGNGPQSGAIR
jgi:antirestriction factor ArdC-like protein